MAAVDDKWSALCRWLAAAGFDVTTSGLAQGWVHLLSRWSQLVWSEAKGCAQ